MKHIFVAISVMPIDVRPLVGSSDPRAVEYAEVPERSADTSPGLFCQVCWAPAEPSILDDECPGPVVPIDLSTMPGQ